jgi:class 3 adenylate cyclase
VSETDPTADGLERKLATILSADVAAYSRLMAKDEEQTLETFRGHKEIFEKLVSMHRGRIFNTAGDAILAEFGSAVEAVRCATDIQAALRTRNDQLPEDRQVKFRIGVNLGDVMVQGQDLLGDGVNVAARLQGAAEPGGICIAGSVYDQILNKLSLSFKPLGDMNYKNIPQPVRTFAIAGADGLGALPSPARRRQASPSPGRIGAVAAAVLLLLAAGAAVWGYSDYRQRQAEAARTVEKRAVQEARQQAEAEKQPAEAIRRNAFAEQQHTNSDALRLTQANREQAAPAPLAAADPAAPPPDPPRSPAPSPVPRAVGDPTGVYGGQICYGEGKAEPARCFRAQAVVMHNRISGEWPGRAPGVTIYLVGEISRSGEVALHMHSKRADGSRFAVSDLIGTLRDGQLDATGSFRNGRSVTLNWRKD